MKFIAMMALLTSADATGAMSPPSPTFKGMNGASHVNPPYIEYCENNAQVFFYHDGDGTDIVLIKYRDHYYDVENPTHSTICPCLY